MSTEPVPGVAVVTGASAGIGRAIAERLLGDGWRVTGLDVAPPTLAHAGFSHRPVDLTDAASIDAAAQVIGVPDAFVHAAGVLRVGALGALDARGGELMWRLHVAAAERLANAWLPAMAERGHGRAVLVGSRVSQGMPGRSQYAATKAALIALSRSWAAELAPHGVTVNVVSPAATRTGMLADPARAASLPRLPPMGRLIEPAEIAALVAFLLSPAAAPITGQDIAVCGGSSLPTPA
ncbi:SDR family oxidoreductase [Achromobacter sp. GG226]|uniref:SDR family NAD(P)-dependent oxidoreductase n=1 Tax=Verticiella alkaliphila TaxID=2779529 RepID=UPI001C0BDFA1|nr:SDR family oxidoreductase [Verticiella sp. GG226]